MLYDSLDILPLKLYYKIEATNNPKLLVFGDTIDESKLSELWAELRAAFMELDKSSESKKVFMLSKEMSSLEASYHAVLMACESLGFEYDEKLIDVIRGYGFSFKDGSTEEYYSSIEKVVREAKSFVMKIDMLKKQLPKDNDDKEKVSLDEIMASYVTILGIDFDFNTISCTKFFAFKKQVNLKLKSVERQLQNIKGNGKR